MNAGLRDRNGLLFHSLVNCDLIRDIHLVEFIDGANAVVCEHERPGFDREVPRLLVLDDCGGETGCGGGFAGGVDRAREE